MSERGAVTGDALDDVAYLARSENRLRVLHALASRPSPRHELADETGCSRTTLGRILHELEEREWVRRVVGGDYVATPRGKHVAAAFAPLLESMEAIRMLGDAVDWIPTEALSIGVRHFADATVLRLDPNHPTGLAGYLAGLVGEASTFESLTYLAPPPSVGAAMIESVLAGRLNGVQVLAGGLYEYARASGDDPLPWGEYVDAGARVYRYDGSIPCNLFVVDGTVLVMEDRPRWGEFIESQNEVVRSWAHALVESYCEAGERLDAEAFR